MKKIVCYASVLLITTAVLAQQKVDRLLVITTDGLRWQELFTGMDSSIANKKEFNQDDSAVVFKKYWNNDPEHRRKLLMPFFWNTFVTKGQVYGNRLQNNFVT